MIRHVRGALAWSIHGAAPAAVGSAPTGGSAHPCRAVGGIEQAAHDACRWQGAAAAFVRLSGAQPDTRTVTVADAGPHP